MTVFHGLHFRQAYCIDLLYNAYEGSGAGGSILSATRCNPDQAASSIRKDSEGFDALVILMNCIIDQVIAKTLE